MSQEITRAVVVVLTVVLAGCAGAPVTGQRPAPASSPAQPSAPPLPAAHTQPRAPGQGGVDTQAHLVAPATIPDVPRLPTLSPADLAAQHASVAEAARSGSHPERLSPLVPPTPFDAAAYARDPQAYLNVVEPGRAWQTAAAGGAVPVLTATSSLAPVVTAHGGTVLAAQAVPGAPVTFTSLDKGVFANGLTSITVATGADGRAQATWQVDPGTSAQVRVLSGSPLASSTLTFRIAILPESPAP